jgi:hypothetical protein
MGKKTPSAVTPSDATARAATAPTAEERVAKLEEVVIRLTTLVQIVADKAFGPGGASPEYVAQLKKVKKALGQ